MAGFNRCKGTLREGESDLKLCCSRENNKQTYSCTGEIKINVEELGSTMR